MVKILSPENKQAVAHAIAEAEAVTSAEIVAVVAAASDAYHTYVLLYGLMVGSAIGMGFWLSNPDIIFPFLLFIQLVVIALFSWIPWLRHQCLRLVPKRIQHRRAAHRAYEEYLVVSRHLHSSAPIVLLYVSQAERYAHILTSRLVREKIPDADWNAVIEAFVALVRKTNLQDACTLAIGRMAQLLTPHFPCVGAPHRTGRTVIEVER